MAGHMPLTNGATAAKEAGYRVGKSKKNPEMATDAADTSAGRSPKRRAAKSDSRPNRMRPAGKRKRMADGEQTFFGDYQKLECFKNDPTIFEAVEQLHQELEGMSQDQGMTM